MSEKFIRVTVWNEYRYEKHNPLVQRILENAVRWVAPAEFGFDIPDGCPCIGQGTL